jgi:hypothetical protein
MPSTDTIERYFADCFGRWGISLPPRDVAARSSGHVFEHGWHIAYVWDTESGEEYLEVLAQHRMTDDRHFRVFATGRVEELPAPSGTYAYASDATEAEKLAAAERNSERNRRIYAALRERGLLPAEGENLAAHEINEFLRSGSEPESD